MPTGTSQPHHLVLFLLISSTPHLLTDTLDLLVQVLLPRCRPRIVLQELVDRLSLDPHRWSKHLLQIYRFKLREVLDLESRSKNCTVQLVPVPGCFAFDGGKFLFCVDRVTHLYAQICSQIYLRRVVLE